MKPFTKRTFDGPLLLRSGAATVATLPVLLAALIKPSTSRVLREQVMLAVTMVNDCRYCSWVHTGLALNNGVDLDALQNLWASELPGEIDSPAAVAILFAKHFADTRRCPERPARTALKQHYTGWQRLEIMAYIHAIYFANLSGNSGDAWIARLQGRSVRDGHPVAEAAAALLAAPVLAAIWLANRRQPLQAAL
ncbi:carboxymuconolactone decarboxylase family protein [Sinimarinibacterium sp. CAU 1509]|uniref:carboxymuconolactone decarboxylase family protein n=1 Tax=Sinimarinibacterium sp. CAU 1509 TaxID=2562283 RepID=UPI0010AC787A|nr:carboxymuconolactone decarboxylase family protein [Sinimarinibacterium sp. CAU 1509]TJY63110.1 carboxymuconolactone decarboxylase family protein [Sinimarinibacterium sp. CAU 1509]